MRDMTHDDDRWFNRPYLLVGAGVLALLVAIALAVVMPSRDDRPEQKVPAPAVPTAPAPPAGSRTDSSAQPTIPSFDVVRVEPDGDAVMAGRGEPGARITIKSGDRTIGDVDADDRGNWVFVPEQPLGPGTHRLVLEAQRQGDAVKLSDDEVVIVVPSPSTATAGADSGGAEAARPLAVKTSRSGAAPSVVLQPSQDTPSDQTLGILTIDDSTGRGLVVGGRAAPQARLRLYLDNRPIGETEADSLGLWRLRTSEPPPAGRQVLRADQIDAAGKVVGRVGVIVDLGKPPVTAEGQVTIERGQNLWRIARGIYGHGTAYVLIYDANRQHIDDPNKIFPGQVFQLPPRP